MPNDDRDWFLSERSEALASLMLTSRPDVTLESGSQIDGGVDLVVAINDGGAPQTRLFVVQVKGTLSSDREHWKVQVKELYETGHFSLPVCVFIVNVRSREAAYAWVAEPRVEGRSVRLDSFEHPDFRSLDGKAVDQIVDQVRRWYDAIPKSIVSQSA